jgi:hypothetical protein
LQPRLRKRTQLSVGRRTQESRNNTLRAIMECFCCKRRDVLLTYCNCTRPGVSPVPALFPPLPVREAGASTGARTKPLRTG